MSHHLNEISVSVSGEAKSNEQLVMNSVTTHVKTNVGISEWVVSYLISIWQREQSRTRISLQVLDQTLQCSITCLVLISLHD